jgi:hypothetical protein
MIVAHGETASLYGLWPRKGTLTPGADADLTLVDPQATHVVRNDRLHPTRPGIVVMLPGSTSSRPTVALVPQCRGSSASCSAMSTASAARASARPRIGVPPVCEERPVNASSRRVEPEIRSTTPTPMPMPARSNTLPCSMCSSKSPRR